MPPASVTPTFPWLGPLGLLPYPVRYRIVYGEPLVFHDGQFGGVAADAAAPAGFAAFLDEGIGW